MNRFIRSFGQGDFGVNKFSAADNDGTDFLVWQQQLGSGALSVSALQRGTRIWHFDLGRFSRRLSGAGG